MAKFYLSSKVAITPTKLCSAGLGVEIELNSELAHEIVSRFICGEEKENAVRKIAEKYSFTPEEIQDVSEFIDRLIAMKILVRKQTDPRNVTVNWDLTKKCNLFCRHCIANTSKTGTVNGELSTKQIVTGLRLLRHHGFEKISFSGGEIFTRHDIWQILAEAKQLGLDTILMTNGVLLGEEEAERLSKLQPVRVQLSLDGASPETNDRIRGRGTFVKIVRVIRLLVERSLPVGLIMTVVDENCHEVNAFAVLAKKLGVDQIGIGKVLMRGRAATNNLCLDIPDMDFSLLAKKVADKIKGRGKTSNPIDNRLRYYQMAKSIPPALPHCPDFYYAITITSQGDVLPCRGLHDSKEFPRELVAVGNMRDEPLETLLRRRAETSYPSLDDFAECRACRYKYICTQNCLMILLAGNKKPGWKPSQDPGCRAFLEEIRVTKQLGYFQD
jgi:radical SAM protein with 4Fe4S-binding SPASM domain